MGATTTTVEVDAVDNVLAWMGVLTRPRSPRISTSAQAD